MTCSKELQEAGEPYPRTCPEHGLWTVCPIPEKKETKGKKGVMVLVTADNHQWASEVTGRSLDYIRGAWDQSVWSGQACVVESD